MCEEWCVCVGLGGGVVYKEGQAKVCAMNTAKGMVKVKKLNINYHTENAVIVFCKNTLFRCESQFCIDYLLQKKCCVQVKIALYIFRVGETAERTV